MEHFDLRSNYFSNKHQCGRRKLPSPPYILLEGNARAEFELVGFQRSNVSMNQPDTETVIQLTGVTTFSCRRHGSLSFL